MFHVGEHVVSKHFGKGVVTHIADPEVHEYPVVVKWARIAPMPSYSLEYFTLNGQFKYGCPDPEYDIIREEEDEEKVGQIASVINYEIVQKARKNMGQVGGIFKTSNEKIEAAKPIFKWGDKVWSPHFGGGFVASVSNNPADSYPIKVHWVDAASKGLLDDEYFTKDGQFDTSGANPDMAIYSLEADHGRDTMTDVLNAFTKADKEEQKTKDAINPSHYRVDGLPEAIDIMDGLMTPEQYEGYLWGNILKYAYRYGRKGDTAETAGKIAWYAQKLKELKEGETK